jgi:uncharacterized protein (DUF1778 family)
MNKNPDMTKQNATEKETELGEERVIHLSLEDQLLFAEALLNPPPMTPALEKAKEAHRRLVKES